MAKTSLFALLFSLIACPGTFDTELSDACLAEHKNCLANPNQYVMSGTGSPAICLSLYHQCKENPPLENRPFEIRPPRQAPKEFQICSDHTDQGNGNPCVSSLCSNGHCSELHPQAIGGRSFGSDHPVFMYHQITTRSPSGTPFQIWWRIYRDDDWDSDEFYDCTIDGVSFGKSTVNFSFTKLGLQGGMYGPNCGLPGANNGFCWAAINNWRALKLDQGQHNLTCKCKTDSPDEGCGYDGIIFTTDLNYVPAPGVPATGACVDDDIFTAGNCYANWGPNVTP